MCTEISQSERGAFVCAGKDLQGKRNMEYEEIKLLKQSEKSTVHLVREKGGSRIFIRKRLAGRHPVYQVLRQHPHPCLPKLYEVVGSEDSTTVTEEYIEGQTSGEAELSGKQFRQVVRELCSVLEFLHKNGIIHRDIKPSNILLTKDGHVRLIDFDAARMPREEAEQDTRLLGTRGFAPPEQYGFAQTDERADIYALGVTLERLLEEENRKKHYRRTIRKCTNLDPNRRYQSVRQVRRAFSFVKWKLLVILMVVLIGGTGMVLLPVLKEGRLAENQEGNAALTVLPPPGNPHWDGETGIVVWDNVLESGVGDEVQFYLRLYRKDNEVSPDANDDDWCFEQKVRQGGSHRNRETITWNIVTKLQENGFYYFMVSAVGDGVLYTDSPWAVSDAFEYTGEDAAPLPAPTGLEWRFYEKDNTRRYYAVWSNLDEYEEKDFFNVTFYDQDGAYVMNNTWSKSAMIENGYGGIPIPAQFLKAEPGSAYRFTVQVYSSRPNEYQSSPMPDPVPEEYFSPWFYCGPRE